MFLGRAGTFIYLLFFLPCIFFTLWMANPIVGTSLGINIPINTGVFRQCSKDDFSHYLHPSDGCWNTYSLFVLIFAAIVVPMSCLELKEQALFQMTMAVGRFLTLLTMSIYSVVAAAETSYHTGTSNTTVTSGDISYAKFDINGFLAAVPVFVYALSLQPSIPSLSQPMGWWVPQ
jgi:amino acid permease